MVKPDLTKKQRDKSERRIYYSAYLRALGIGFLSYISVVSIIIWGISFLFLDFINTFFPHKSGLFGGLFAGLISVMSTAQARGMHALRQAGLLHEEDLLIVRTADGAHSGPTVEMPSSLWSKLIIICCCLLLCATLVWLIFINSDSRFFQIACFVGAMMMGGITVLVFVNLNQPEVRLDDRGIFVCSSGLEQKLVPWRRIARARFQRVESAPKFGLFSLLEPDTSETISLEDDGGKSLLTLNGGVFAGSPTIKERFVAELKRRLTGVKPLQGEENRDE